MILSHGMARALDAQSGFQKDGVAVSRNKDTSAHNGNTIYGSYNQDSKDATYGSGGGASRYFLNAGYEPWELEWIYQNGLRPCWLEEL